MVAIGRIIAPAGLLLTLSLTLSVSLVGCGQRFRYEGQWIGQGPAPEGVDDPVVARTVAQVRLTITDLRFQLMEGGLPKDGEAVFSPKNVTLNVRRILEKPVESLDPEMKRDAGSRFLEPQPDGSLLMTGGPFGTITLTRATQPSP